MLFFRGPRIEKVEKRFLFAPNIVSPQEAEEKSFPLFPPKPTHIGRLASSPLSLPPAAAEKWLEEEEWGKQDPITSRAKVTRGKGIGRAGLPKGPNTILIELELQRTQSSLVRSGNSVIGRRPETFFCGGMSEARKGRVGGKF